MRVNGIRCDGCGKEHLFEPTLIIDRGIPYYMPADWFTVFQGKPEEHEPWAFCSKSCLRHHPLTNSKEEV